MTEIRRYLVTLHERKSDGSLGRLLGNGGIVVGANETRTIVTAAHVAFAGRAPRALFIKGDKDALRGVSGRLHFRQRFKRDIAELELPPGDGLPLAEKLLEGDLEGLRIMGWRAGSEYDMRLKPIMIEMPGGKTIRLNIPRDGLVTGANLYYETEDGKRGLQPGTSGSMVLKDGIVVGVNTYCLDGVGIRGRGPNLTVTTKQEQQQRYHNDPPSKTVSVFRGDTGLSRRISHV